MTIIVVMAETLPLAEIKAHLSEIVDRVEREHERVVLTRNGRPAAVIMSAADLEALEDTLDLLSDPPRLYRNRCRPLRRPHRPLLLRRPTSRQVPA